MDHILDLIEKGSPDAFGEALHELTSSKSKPDLFVPLRDFHFVKLILANLHGDSARMDVARSELRAVLQQGDQVEGLESLDALQEISPVVLSGDRRALRRVFEISAQRNDWLVNLGPCFTALERRLLEGRGQEPDTPYYSDSSYLARVEGLTKFAAGDLRNGEARLREAFTRYNSVELYAEAVRTTFDLGLVTMAAEQLEEAGRLNRALQAARSLKQPFGSLSARILKAFVDMDLSGWQKVRGELEEANEFSENAYKAIWAQLEDSLVRRRRAFGFLSCERATLDMVPDLLTLATEVPLPSQIGELRSLQDLVGRSNLTVEGIKAWQQGGVYLIALHSSRDDETQIVGASQIVPLVTNGYWRRRKIARESRTAKVEVFHDFLQFCKRSSDEVALELAGNSVLPSKRGLRIGRFNTEARILFLKIHGKEILESIGWKNREKVMVYSNLLPPRTKDGQYPFFERVVRPLINDSSYEYLDKARYEGVAVLEDLLAEVSGDFPAMTFPMTLLPDDVRGIGAIREETLPARAALGRFCFQHHNKFDALDAGQYVEIELKKLEWAAATRELLCRPHRALWNDAQAFYATLAPVREKMSEFAALRTLVRVSSHAGEIEIDEAACQRIELSRGERVVLLAPSSPRPSLESSGK